MERLDRRWLRQGVVAGLIGAVLVAVWFFLFDALQGQPFRTPALLGAAVFQGLRDPQALTIAAGPVLGYTVLHGLAFVAFGLLCAMLIVAAEREPFLLLAFIALFGCFSVFFLGLLWVLAQWLLGALSWWAIVVANLLAAAGMLGYFLLSHRTLGQALLGSLAGVVKEGVVAGLIGAALVAVWFLVFDTVQGRPLHTPALLGAALFEGLRDPGLLQVGLGLVAGYTLLHGAAFIAFGILCAILIVAAEREPSLTWAFVALFACFEIFFVALDRVFAESALGGLVWWAILVGNLLAAAGMLAYFFLGHRALGRSLVGDWAGVIREGFVAGLIGAAVVAVWFLAYDAFRGQPFRTPALLGAAVFQGLSDPAALQINPGVVLGYTVLHGLSFVVFGMIAAFLLVAAERQPVLLLGLFMLFAAFEVFFFGLVMILGQSLLGALVWWAIFVANLLAAAGMLTYFFLGHRALGRRLVETWPPPAE
ncbi:MAG: hypothetical protein HY726_15680 [Candidatus Rokubacteria bacterium]|nr:hypothetical protein [Candidatus Rokubacteria bacterium]